MANTYPTWAYRDLETLITWLLDASIQLANVENESNLSKPLREQVSDARTNVKAALMIAREIRSTQENLLSEEGSPGNGEITQAPQTETPRAAPTRSRARRD